MPQKARKNFTLSIEVLERLEEEDNMSETVEDLLREKYDL